MLLSLQNGKPGDWAVIPLSTWGLRKVVKRAFEAAGIWGVRTSPYALRHSFGGHFLAQGGDIAMLQRILGHRNVKDTMRYTHIADKAVFEAYRRYGPRVTNHP